MARQSDVVTSACSVGQCRNRKDSIRTRAAGCSNIGNVRKQNDDLVFAGCDCRLYVVLDGVGGYAGGGEASSIVLEQLRGHIEAMCEKNPAEATRDLEPQVRSALKDASRSMVQLAAENPEFAKMSTVFALAYVVDGVMLYTHVGDCRVYVIRDQKAVQLTNDETFVQLMVETGVIRPEEVAEHPMRNIIVNSVGTQEAFFNPVVHTQILMPGDTIVLTTDGVTDYLTSAQLVEPATTSDSPQERAEAIVQAALDAGSKDNVSCVVAMVERSGECDAAQRAELHFELARLHDTLGEIDSLDDNLRSELREVAEDIRLALKQPSPAELSGFGARLNQSVEAFADEHPRLTSLVSNIANMLSQMGI